MAKIGLILIPLMLIVIATIGITIVHDMNHARKVKKRLEDDKKRKDKK